MPVHGLIRPSPANLHVALDWLDVARRCRMPMQSLHASPRVAPSDNEGFDGFELLTGHFHDAPHHPPWSSRRALEELEPVPVDGPPIHCSYTSLSMDGGDDTNDFDAFPDNPRANWSTSVHCSGAGLTALPQPLPSDAVYLSVGWFSVFMLQSLRP